ncbi:MAG: hypothetical protein ACK5QC_11545 [Bacteroidota bacterium]|jgi:hypothetical protein
MAKFISVFTSKLDLTYWEGVQEANSLANLKAQNTYRAGNNFNHDKKQNDKIVGEKQITEENTGATATVKMIELSDSANLNFVERLTARIKNLFGLFLFSFIATIIISGCSTNGHLTRRYKCFTLKETNEINNYVKVDAYIIEKEKEASISKKSIFDLSPQGQKELIKQIGLNETESDKIINTLLKPLSASSTSNIEFVDYTKFDKRVVVTIKNISHYPADRISKINVRIKLDDKLRLLSCNRLTTEWQTLDLGKLNYSNVVSGELSGNLSLGSTLVNGGTNGSSNEQTNTLINGTNTTNTGNDVTKNTSSNTSSNSETGTSSQGLNGKLSGSRTFAEEVMLRRRIVSLNASISENTLDLFQESISGIDLTGNILADIVFDGNSSNQNVAVEKVFTFSDLLDINKKYNDPDKIKVKEFYVRYINYTDDLTASIEFDADVRHVKRGDKTISEADDVVEMYTGSYAPKEKKDTSKPLAVVILRKDQLNPKFWVLQLLDETKSKIPVEILSPTGTKGTLKFNSITDVKDFNSWLKEKFNGTADGQGVYTMTLVNGYKLIFPAGFAKIDDIGIRSN